ncbi:MAG: type III PLP-dependent enzyme [Acidobacteria bacterium]|nr:type III PLP-dependent enzyme [Acidobacteriota bacterium]
MKRGNSARSLILLPKASDGPTVSFDRAVALAETLPTPFLVLSTSRVHATVRALRRTMPRVELFYAMKSNPDPELLRLLNGLVDGIDVASYGEVVLADAAGFSPDRLFHSNPIKKESDITDCVRHGIRWFTFDNSDEIPKLAAAAPGADVLLRLAIQNSSCVVDLGAKFGAHHADAVRLMLAARDAGVNVRGVAFHVGSQSTDPTVYLTALTMARSVFDQAAAAGLNLDTLDIGGGFPVTYRTEVPTLEEFCRVVTQGLTELFPEHVRVIAEPGRCISGGAMTLVVRVIGRSVRNGVPWYFIDDGVYGAFSGKLFDHCDYPLMAMKKGAATECVVAGPTCDSIDVVSRDQMLPELEIGDLLLVPGMGAYTKASATSFNGFAPPVTVVEPDERVSLKRRRVTTRVARIAARSLAAEPLVEAGGLAARKAVGRPSA